MRVAFVGNQDNNAYRLCGWMRQLGVDADLYLTEGETERGRPEHVDRSLSPDSYPAWIRQYDNRGRRWYLKRSAVADTISGACDVVVTSGQNGLLALPQFRGIPVVHLSLGCEVTTLPWKAFRRGVPWKERIWSLAARRALGKADRVLTGYAPTMKSLLGHGMKSRMRIWGYPEDVEGNRSRVDGALLGEIEERYRSCRRVFLWLSRVVYTCPGDPNYKGTEKFLAALGRVVRSGGPVQAVVGEHGDDLAAFRKLVAREGLEEHVEFVPHLPFWKLLTWLSLSKAVVFDEIDEEKGELSGIAREALSVGAVMVKSVDRSLAELNYGPGCPIIDAVDEEGCFRAMERSLEADDEAFAALQEGSRTWAREFMDYRTSVPKFAAQLRELVYHRRLEGPAPPG